ncbi:MAG: hypothetical protein E7Z90_02955 [Cyanobacteria bacterium SIG29]|nr:hypothetical protein [Cyanobacteria bacterium SIG29]
MLLKDNETDLIFDEKQLAEIFYSGCKTEQKIGVESEKLLVYKNNNQAVKYDDVVKILNCFDKNEWQELYENNNLMGLKSNFGIISLEPGSQIELSLQPFKSLEEINAKLIEYYANLDNYAQLNGTKVLNFGIQPISTYEDITIIPKKRYEYMTKYLPTKGNEPFVMMRETAGIQANFDYKNEDDAIKKLSLALKMSPIISAIYSNSPIRKGELNGYKSFRANSWLNVDEQRCGYISKKLFDKNEHFTFKDYVEILLDIPMIFVQQNNSYIPTTQTFRQYLQTKQAKLSDWMTHLSLYFPDVRLKSYVEIRNHDAQTPLMTFSVPAFWKGIMYNEDAISEIEKILSKYTYEDFMELREEAPKHAIKSKLGNFEIIDFIKEFFDISYASLKSNNMQEEKYLDCVYEYISLKRTPADDIIDNFS